jgi:hypothetical protein
MRFLHSITFDDAAAEQSHQSLEGVRRFTSIQYPELVNGVTFTDYRVARST